MQHVDFYYSIPSRYSYLASSQIEALETDTSCSVEWQPLSSVCFRKERGTDPFEGAPVSGEYEWPFREKDAVRWAELYGTPFVEPRGRVDFDPDLLALACTAAKRLGHVKAFSRELFSAMFEGTVSRIDVEECIRRGERCGIARADFEADLGSRSTHDQLDSKIRTAREAGVFGVPSFVTDGELFWGNDRLVLLRHHLDRSRTW